MESYSTALTFFKPETGKTESGQSELSGINLPKEFLWLNMMKERGAKII